MAARAQQVKELKRVLASLAEDALDRAIALGPEPLQSLLDELPPREGIGFQPSWRVKRELWPRVQRTLAAAVAVHLEAGTIEPVEGLERWMPPALWSERMLGARVAMAPAGIGLVRVPAGQAQLGPRASDRRHQEADVAAVAITFDLWVGATPVTQGQWAAVMGESTPEHPDRPTLRRRSEVVAFCNALSEREGLAPAYVDGELTALAAPGYRLLSEAEWEYAARAGTSTATYAGDVKVDYGANPHLDPFIAYGASPGSPVPDVATRIPNAWGLYDMLGTAWELCEDVWSERRPRGNDPLETGRDQPTEARHVHVVRGGAHHNFACLTIAGVRMDSERRPAALRVARPASASKPELRLAVEAPAVLRSPWRDVALELPHGRPRCVRTDGEHTWVGTSGSLATSLHAVLIGDVHLLAIEHDHRTPWLVSQLEVVDQTLWVSLGPGHLYAYADRGLTGGHRLELEVTNAPRLAVHEGSLLVGTTWQGLGVWGEGWIEGLSRKMLSSCALDEHRIYAGYDDGRVRVHDRRTHQRLGVLKTGSSVAMGKGRVYVGARDGRISIHDPESRAVTGTFQHEKRSPYTLGLRCHGERVISWDGGSVQIQDPDGVRTGRWTCPDGHGVNDVYPVQHDLYVAVRDDEKTGGRVLRLSLES